MKERTDYHKDGSIHAKGMVTDEGVLTGYWEWYRKDGTLKRSGHFDKGEQCGEWITYDTDGKPFKTTHFKKSK